MFESFYLPEKRSFHFLYKESKLIEVIIIIIQIIIALTNVLAQYSEKNVAFGRCFKE